MLALVVAFVLLVGVGELVLTQFDLNRRAEAQSRLLSQLVDARALLEAEVSEGIYVTIGLESFIESQKGDPDFKKIKLWMASLFEQTRHLRNIGIAPDNQITAVYPKEGNADAIGVHYRELPDQWSAVQEVMESGNPTLVGPINLVQGGKGLIYRTPVAVDGEYWGVISTVMKFSSIIEAIDRFGATYAGEYRLVKVTPNGPETIAGTHVPEPKISESLDIKFPGGLHWRMTMSETLSIWPLWGIRAVVWSLGLIVAVLIWQWLRSSQIAREVEARSVQERTEFIHSVSHELRTPLTSIRGAVGLLEREHAKDPKTAHLLSVASRNLQRLQRLVDEVLDLARLDASRMQLRIESVRLPELVHQAIENNEHYASQHELTLLTRVSPGAEEALVEVDNERFLQVMDNLVSNAIKFSDSGQTIEIQVERKGEWCEVRVADKGAGIPAAFRRRIFDRFARADSSDKRRNQSGTGLGLSIVRELVLAMNGEIDVQSEEGVGTIFTVRFPTQPQP